MALAKDYFQMNFNALALPRGRRFFLMGLLVEKKQRHPAGHSLHSSAQLSFRR